MFTNRRVGKLWQSHNNAIRMTGHNLCSDTDEFHKNAGQKKPNTSKCMCSMIQFIRNLKTGEIKLRCWKSGELPPLGTGRAGGGAWKRTQPLGAGTAASGSGGWPHWLMFRLRKSTKLWFKILYTFLHAYCASIQICLKCYLTEITWVKCV